MHSVDWEIKDGTITDSLGGDGFVPTGGTGLEGRESRDDQ